MIALGTAPKILQSTPLTFTLCIIAGTGVSGIISAIGWHFIRRLLSSEEEAVIERHEAIMKEGPY